MPPFFPKTTKHPGDKVYIPKFPASFFAGLSQEKFEGVVQTNGQVKWKGAQPDNCGYVDDTYSCLLK